VTQEACVRVIRDINIAKLPDSTYIVMGDKKKEDLPQWQPSFRLVLSSG
jgi:hypothetical protein